jgi:hypothetical protein
MVELIAWMERRGVLGALVVTVLATAFAAFGWYLLATAGPWNGGEVWSPRVSAVGLACLVAALGLGILALKVGFQSASFPMLARAPMGHEAFAQALSASAVPFFACLSCRQVFSISECFGRCPKCDSVADCLEIRSDAERKTALAAAGRD